MSRAWSLSGVRAVFIRQPITPPAARRPPQTVVEIAFSADRNQLFSAWNAVANLADLAGKVAVTCVQNPSKASSAASCRTG